MTEDNQHIQARQFSRVYFCLYCFRISRNFNGETRKNIKSNFQMLPVIFLKIHHGFKSRLFLI